MKWQNIKISLNAMNTLMLIKNVMNKIQKAKNQQNI